MKLLAAMVIPLLLSGCWSQIFLDDVSDGENASDIATGVRTKNIHISSSRACEHSPSATRYQIRERVGRAWMHRCARIQGFEYQPGNDYILQVKEYQSGDAGARLVLEKVITSGRAK